jgi:outer membrane protein
VNLPIFDGGLIGAQVKENQQLVKSSQLNLSQLQRSANYDVRSAYNNFTAQAAQYFRLQEADRVQAESYRVQQEDYDLGRTSNLDVLQALSNLQQTRRRLVATEMQARASLAALQVAAGTMQKRKSS